MSVPVFASKRRHTAQQPTFAWPFAKSAQSFTRWPAHVVLDTGPRLANAIRYESDSTVDQQSGPPAPKKRVAEDFPSAQSTETVVAGCQGRFRQLVGYGGMKDGIVNSES